MPKGKDLTGQKFGRLTVIEKTDKRDSSRCIIWRCKCDCGKETLVSSSSLTRGHTKSCGCYNRDISSLKNTKDLLGQRFGRLTVIEKTNQRDGRAVQWKCKCDCGNIVIVTGSSLTRGNTQSCGCYNRDMSFLKNTKDLTGQQFGHLKVIKNTNKRDNSGNYIWECECNCGNTIEVNGASLTRGHTQSCGCIKSRGEEKIAKILRDNNISFEQQKTFTSCIFPETQGFARFDFWISDKYLLEYDGAQHFQDAWSSLESTKQKDDFKNAWCKEHNIPLIRIPYTRFENLSIQDLLLETSQYIFKGE